MQKIGLVATGLLTLASSAVAKNNPNILLIVTDQQSYDALNAYQDMFRGVYANTPNLNRLAEEGLSFTRAYCSNPVSVPSRFALFTGQFGSDFGVTGNACTGATLEETKPMLDKYAMGQVFKQAGYETVYAGKVHLPFAGPSTPDQIKKEEMHKKYLERRKAHPEQFKGKKMPAWTKHPEKNNCYNAPTHYGFDQYLTDDERMILAEKTAEYIQSKKDNNGKPFLMVASFINPHDICFEGSLNFQQKVPWKKKGRQESIIRVRKKAASVDSLTFYNEWAPELPYNFAEQENVPEKLLKKYKFPEWYWRKYRWVYKDMVRDVDEQIGVVLDALDANPALKKNTIIIFTSDHGEMQGAHQKMFKSMPYDECQRIPFIFVGPNIKAGARNNGLVCNGTDLLPTMCDLAGVQPAVKYHGLSLADWIHGKRKDVPRKYMYTEATSFQSIVTDEYKYSYFPSEKPSETKELLVDLKNDPGEKVNLAADAKYASVMKDMRDLLQREGRSIPPRKYYAKKNNKQGAKKDTWKKKGTLKNRNNKK